MVCHIQWSVTLIVLLALAIVLFFGKAIATGAAEGWREVNAKAKADAAAYELPEECAALGLLPRDQLDRTAPGPEPEVVTAALTAAVAGDWKPAAELMRETAEAKDWEHRSGFAYTLGDKAAEDDAWLLAWETARPDDPDAAVVRARSTVSLAWNIRGAKRAQYTTGEQFQGFHTVLARSREEMARAAELNPADPDHPRLAEVRHVLAYFLSFQDRDEAAVEQFKLVDGYVGSLSWSYRGDPAASYCHLRDLSVKAATKAS